MRGAKRCGQIKENQVHPRTCCYTRQDLRPNGIIARALKR